MTNTPRPSAATAPRLSWVLGLTSAAYFMVVLDSVVVITALPRMQRDLHLRRTGAPGRLDLPGVTLVTGGIVAIVWALVRANQSGWASAEIVSCLSWTSLC